MVFSKKGKRKIIVNNIEYYWCLSQDVDTHTMPVTLTVLFDEGVFCTHQWNYKDVPISITPSLVRKVIVAHIDKQTV